MPSRAIRIKPEEYILPALSRKDRLDTALAVAGEAFKSADLTMADIDKAVKSIRKKAHEKKK